MNWLHACDKALHMDSVSALRADLRAEKTAGSTIEMISPMMAMTTSSSIRLKARRAAALASGERGVVVWGMIRSGSIPGRARAVAG
jgi:hypothetical protein